MRVVVDTNVFVSAALKEVSPPGTAAHLAAASHALLKSTLTEQELFVTLARPRLASLIPPRFQEWLREVLAGAELVAITERIAACRDPKDDKFLELAVSGQSRGDRLRRRRSARLEPVQRHPDRDTGGVRARYDAIAPHARTADERARDMRQPRVYVLNHSQHNFRKRSTQEDLDEIEDWTDRAARRMYEGAGLGPNEVDIFNPYNGYAPMAQFFLEGFQWHGVKRGDAFAFYAGDIRVEGPHPFCSSGGNLGTGRCRTAMYTDSIEQLRGTAGTRQVRVRAETALAAFTTPRSGGWIMFGKSPN